ncbi:hypothetical protein BXU10_12395 [Flavobacterium sp. LM4]|nr:hypothetical protein BXU10_12395 [Flavobacterium sp. LM4]
MLITSINRIKYLLLFIMVVIILGCLKFSVKICVAVKDHKLWLWFLAQSIFVFITQLFFINIFYSKNQQAVLY